MSKLTDFFMAKPAETPVVETKGLSAPNPTTDASGKIPGSEQAPINPLDAYTEMYNNANKSSDIQAPSFKIDPEVLGKVSKSMDFTKGIAPELLDKALSGDTKSLLAVIQSVGQNSYSSALEHTTALTETHLASRSDYEKGKLNAGVREQLTSNALESAPNYSHPVVKAELNRVAKMFAASNPDSSPQEIAKAAQKHIQDLSAALKAPEESTNSAEKADEIDWTKYLSPN